MRGVVTLSTDRLRADVDLDRGAEIASLCDVASGTELLLTTPWAERARQVRPSRLAHPASAGEVQWMESYAGGWQTLFPHAGPAAVVDGAERDYHGEASSVAWIPDGRTETSLAAHLELYSVPVRIDRAITLSGGRITVADTLTNLSATSVTYDYQSHPAFGAPFLDGACTIHADADSYTPDGRFDLGEFDPGEAVAWGADGGVDLTRVPADDERLLRFGWLGGFRRNRVTIANPRLDLAVTLEWSDDGRPFAWLWEEAHAHTWHPWFGRGYAIAIEPSTRTTDGSGGPSPRLAPSAAICYETSLTVHPVGASPGPPSKESIA